MVWIERGGPVMWPLLALSLWTVWLVLERSLFWWRTRSSGPRTSFERAQSRWLGGAALDGHGLDELLSREERRAARGLLGLEITVAAAPMLGILGTVLGIIDAFELLSVRSDVDPLAVSGGVAQALITTASGLVIALVALLPAQLFRAWSDQHLEVLEIEGRRRLYG